MWVHSETFDTRHPGLSLEPLLNKPHEYTLPDHTETDCAVALAGQQGVVQVAGLLHSTQLPQLI